MWKQTNIINVPFTKNSEDSYVTCKTCSQGTVKVVAVIEKKDQTKY